jgi:hypothetical protein
LTRLVTAGATAGDAYFEAVQSFAATLERHGRELLFADRCLLIALLVPPG